MSIFDALFDEKEKEIIREKEIEVFDKRNEDRKLKAQAHFTVISGKYRVQMNKALNFTEKYKIAIELIRELTGDELFYITHMKDIGAIPEDDASIKESMQKATILDTSRRVEVNEHRYKADQTAINEYIYESSLIDLEILAMERSRFESEEDYQKAIEDKIIEKQSLVDIYRTNIARKEADENVS